MNGILISVDHNEGRLEGSLNRLMRGPNPPQIMIYDDSGTPDRPNAITDAPTGVLLASVVLRVPAGEVADNKLVLALPDDALVLANGTARWARIVNGNGGAWMDVDVSEAGGNGQIKVTKLAMLAGGATRLISGVLG